MNIPSVLKLIVPLSFLATLPAQVLALTPDQVFDKVKDSIVVVKTLDTQGKVISQGSGVLLPSGKIATNCHVVEGSDSYQVGRGKKLVLATLYAEDGDKDICLLNAKGITGKPAQLGKAANLKVGGAVYAIGAPQGLELSISDGIVAQLRGGPAPLIQTTAAISPGSSGGGLFDEEGRLVGLTTLYVQGGQNLNFTIPVEWIVEIMPGRKPNVKSRSHIESQDKSIDKDQSTSKSASEVRLQENEWIRIVGTYDKNLTEDEVYAVIKQPTPEDLKGKIIGRSLYVHIEFMKYCKATREESPLDRVKSNATDEEFAKAAGESLQSKYLKPRHRCDYRTTVFATFYNVNGIEIETKDEIPMAIEDKNNPGRYKYEVLPGEERYVGFSIPDKATSWKVWVPK